MQPSHNLNKLFKDKKQSVMPAGSARSAKSTESPSKKVFFPASPKFDLLTALAKAEVVGRGGAAFPTDKKWQRLKELGQPIGFVVCNASEGELNVTKDFYILQVFPEMVVKGMVEAMQYLNVKTAYFNINRHYYEKLGESLKKITDRYQKKLGLTFKYFIEEPSYIGGETGALLNAIEGKRVQPRLSPPSASLTGIFGQPVLLNNVETFYDVARVAAGVFKPTRYATIVGPVANPGVFEVNRDWTVAQVLKETKNWPATGFFVQVGGGASGLVVNQQQIEMQPLIGCASIEVFGQDTQPYDILMRWFGFYMKESCGKCTPCREGTYQLYQLLKNLQFGQDMPWTEIKAIIETLKVSAFCDLGRSLAIPVESYMTNILGLKV